MTQAQIAIGASASCTDEAAGQVIRVVVNPADLTVTHLVIGPKHAHGHHIHRLVPVDLTEIRTDGIRLSCTKAVFDKLDPAEERTSRRSGSTRLMSRTRCGAGDGRSPTTRCP